MANIEKPIWSKDKQTLSNVLIRNRLETYNVTDTWYDGTPMDDTKVDDDLVYVKYEGKYLVRNFEYGQVLQKDTMQQMRDLSPYEILLLEMGVFKHVQLNGYYEKGDTPEPIEYAISNSAKSDNSGNIVEYNSGFKLEHEVSGNQYSVKYFGVADHQTAIYNTTQINKCLEECQSVVIDSDLDINVDQLFEYESFTINLQNVIVIPSNRRLEINGTIRFSNPETSYYAVISISDVENVVVTGNGIIEGNYLVTSSIASGSGHGVCIHDSTNILVENITSTLFQGDGIYLSGRRRDQSTALNQNIILRNLKLPRNSRQGISIIKGDKVLVENNIIEETGIPNGTVLGCGIDLEPEYHLTISNVQIVNNTFINNYSNSVNLLILKPTAEITNIIVKHNKIYQGGEGGASFGINVRKNSPSLDAGLDFVSIHDNEIFLNHTRAQRGISVSNRVDNVSVRENVVRKMYPEQDATRGMSLASVRNFEVVGNKFYGDFEYGIYGESNYTRNVIIKENWIESSETHIYARQLNGLTIIDNSLTEGHYGIDIASVSNLKIKSNTISQFNSYGIGLITNVINYDVSNNTLEDCAILTASDVEETDLNRSWIAVQSFVSASPSKYGKVEGNFFIKSPETALYRHISAPNNITRYLNVTGNYSNEEDLVVFNNSLTGNIKSPHRTFGITAQRPSELPSFSSGYFFDITTKDLYFWDGSQWVGINREATLTERGLMRMSAAVAGISLPDLSEVSPEDLTELVSWINDTLIPLININKLKVNQILNTDKESGQRQST